MSLVPEPYAASDPEDSDNDDEVLLFSPINERPTNSSLLLDEFDDGNILEEIQELMPMELQNIEETDERNVCNSSHTSNYQSNAAIQTDTVIDEPSLLSTASNLSRYSLSSQSSIEQTEQQPKTTTPNVAEMKRFSKRLKAAASPQPSPSNLNSQPGPNTLISQPGPSQKTKVAPNKIIRKEFR